jgi:hypothetical protein
MYYEKDNIIKHGTLIEVLDDDDLVFYTRIEDKRKFKTFGKKVTRRVVTS